MGGRKWYLSFPGSPPLPYTWQSDDLRKTNLTIQGLLMLWRLPKKLNLIAFRHQYRAFLRLRVACLLVLRLSGDRRPSLLSGPWQMKPGVWLRLVHSFHLHCQRPLLKNCNRMRRFAHHHIPSLQLLRTSPRLTMMNFRWAVVLLPSNHMTHPWRTKK